MKDKGKRYRHGIARRKRFFASAATPKKSSPLGRSIRICHNLSPLFWALQKRSKTCFEAIRLIKELAITSPFLPTFLMFG
jgi:hypothetical protein